MGSGKFQADFMLSFPFLPNDVINNISTDQYYSYRMCWAFINGEVDEDLAHLEIGPLNHSRWLTFACRILRFYVSQLNQTRNLCLITEFAIKVYFQSWFDIKAIKKLTDGSKNLYNMIVRINCLSDKKIKDICYNVLKNNSFFAHGENILVSMLSDSDEFLRRKTVNIIMKLRENGEQVSEGESTEEVNNNVDFSHEMIESFSNMSQYSPMDKSVSRGGVEDTRLEAKAKDTKKIQGQGQPFRGQTLSRPRTGMIEAKDQGHKRKCSPKKKGLHKNFLGDLQKKKKKKVFTKIFQAISTKKRFLKNFSSAPQSFNNSKNTAVLEPRTGQFSRT